MSQSVAWVQVLLQLFGGLDFVEDGAAMHAFQWYATRWLWVTAFAYLFHEAVGVRSTEAAVLLCILSVLVRGLTAILSALLEPTDVEAAGELVGAELLLQYLLSHAGLALLLITVPRGLSCFAILEALASSPASSTQMPDSPVHTGASAAPLEMGGCCTYMTGAQSLSTSTNKLRLRRGSAAVTECELPESHRGNTGIPAADAFSDMTGGNSLFASGYDDAPQQLNGSTSLLAQPLPTRRSTMLVVVRSLPARTVQFLAVILWVQLLIAVLVQLVSLALLQQKQQEEPQRQMAAAISAAGSSGEALPAPESNFLFRVLPSWLWYGTPPPPPPPPLPAPAATSWLALYFICVATAGHYLVCHYRLFGTRTQRSPSLHTALLQTAALQVQAATLPVATHALGLMPHAVAVTRTALPLCGKPLHAGLFCIAFLASNLVGALLFAFPRATQKTTGATRHQAGAAYHDVHRLAVSSRPSTRACQGTSRNATTLQRRSQEPRRPDGTRRIDVNMTT